MPSVNTTSVREQLQALKAEYQRLCANGTLAEAACTLFQALLALVELLMAVFMEKRTPKTPRNCGLPASQRDKADETATQPGANSKGKRYHGARASHPRTVESVEVAPVSACERCGEDLRATPCQDHERRTRIDSVFEKVVSHVDAEIKPCPHCQALTKGAFPADLPGPLQYGPGIKAYVINLLIAQMLALERVQESIRTLIDRALSEATLLSDVMQLHQALAAWEKAAIEPLLAQPVLHVDETSWRVDKKNHWIHVCSSGDITLKFLHPKRGGEAIEAINIIPRYGGTLIHDCWAAYLAYETCDHGLCGSHLLRELTFSVESNGYRWAANMKRLLKQTGKLIAERPSKQLDESEYQKLRKRYRNILTRGEKELPPIPPKPKGKRGRVAKTDAHNLWERLKFHEKAVLLFAEVAHVPFTNNRAERDLRMSKVKQKVSGCFRTRQFAEAYCRISSYLQTMANRGYNPLVAIQMALSGQIYAETGE